MASTTLFDRVAIVTIGSMRIYGLRVSFKVTRTTSAEPNTLELQVFNMRAASRASAAKGARVILEAGYNGINMDSGNVGMLFTGNITRVSHEKQGGDIITKIEAGDGAAEISSSHSSHSFAPGTTVATAFKQIIDDMKVGAGNAMEMLAKKGVAGAIDAWVNGFTAHGKSAAQLDKVLGAAGLSWSIQDGQLQVTAPNEPAAAEAVVLSAKTGMLGSPQFGKDGELIVKSLLQPALKPGRRLKLEAKEVQGYFLAGRVAHTGDTHGGEFSSEVEARPL